MRFPVRATASIALLLAFTATAAAQTFETIGTRAQGMGGAFVGVADDASAVYWNPAGLASGAYFSLLIDGSTADASLDAERSAGRRGGWILALTTPALGLSYYRLRSTAVRPIPTSATGRLFELDSLVTHHAGITLVQSLAEGIAVGATAKLIRGVAASVPVSADAAEDLLDGWDVMGRTSSEVDLDVGVMATGALGNIGLTVRNVTEPSFAAGDDNRLQLERQVRGGASVVLLPTWKLAADVDFTKSRGPLGEVREVAVGSELQATRRLAARAGVRLNTAGDRGRTPGWSVGASYAVFGSVLIDAQATAGSDDTLRGWGVAGRIVF